MPSWITDAYQHPANLTHKYIKYARPYSCVSTIYRHPTNWDAFGGNPCLLVFHAGSWVSVDFDQDLHPPATPPSGPPFVPNRGHQAVFAGLVNPVHGFSNPPFTLISCEYPQGRCGSMPQTYPSYGYWDDQRAIGRAVQYYRDNGHRWGINRDAIFTWGQSAGSCNAMTNLLSPSLPFLPNHRAGSRWDRYSSSRVIAHLNWYGEITCLARDQTYSGPPNTINANPSGVNGGLWGTSPVDSDDWSEHELIPETVQKRSSPLHILKLKREENKGLNMLSVYATSELGNQSGHDPRQLPVLEVAAREAGLKHESILTATNSTADMGNTLTHTYAWLQRVYAVSQSRRQSLALAPI